MYPPNRSLRFSLSDEGVWVFVFPSFQQLETGINSDPSPLQTAQHPIGKQEWCLVQCVRPHCTALLSPHSQTERALATGQAAKPTELATSCHQSDRRQLSPYIWKRRGVGEGPESQHTLADPDQVVLAPQKAASRRSLWRCSAAHKSAQQRKRTRRMR